MRFKRYAFEKGAEKTGGGDGFADVWRRDCFAWEYKGKRKDLVAAYRQLLEYREALDNPPLLVVCDLYRFEIHTNFTGTAKTVYRFSLDDLATAPAEPLRLLRALFLDPGRLKPETTRQELTEAAAQTFAHLAISLRDRGNEAQSVAHFLDRLLFCLFAEDAELLPPRLMERLAEATRRDPAAFSAGLSDLFARMSQPGGGLFGVERIEWFNGSLFDGSEVIPLTADEVETVLKVARLDWAEIEPAIFGTLFERGLDPDRRSQLGAHYTDRDSIVRLVEPVLMAPLRREYTAMQARVQELIAQGYGTGRRAAKPENDPRKVFEAFLDRLRSVSVLDPACGSGNFLYVALQSLKDLEREAINWGSLTMKFMAQYPQVGPGQLHGIEVNPYAAELTRVTIWIGEIQWMLRNGFAYLREPILRPLHNIETKDALIDWSHPDHPREADWPDAEVIIGNPPFLGNRLLRRALGDNYTESLFGIFDDRLPHASDFVCYWHEKARAMVEAGRAKRVGLLATQGIRGRENRTVLERIKASGDIFLAWSDEPWVLDGAAVHVSFVGYDDGSQRERMLNGHAVSAINTDLTAGLDLTKAVPLLENRGIAFMGDIKAGPFEIDDATATEILRRPNPDERRNSDVIRPWANGLDIGGRPRSMWIIDFGLDMPEGEAALYEAAFEYALRVVRPVRLESRSECCRTRWWIHHNRRPAMMAALAGLPRFVVTIRHSKHRLFAWMAAGTVPDSALIAFARDDDYTLGVLQSRVHDLWARGTGTQVREVESGFRYTPTTTFETFPFPRPTAEQRDEIASAAKRLNELREGWLNPPGADEIELKLRTLTNLYNEMPQWLRDVHARLDRAVLAAYGWPEEVTDDDLVARLLQLNLERVALA